MPFQTPKNTLGWTLPAVQDTTQTIKPTKAKAKPPRNLRVKTPPRAANRLIMPGKAGGR